MTTYTILCNIKREYYKMEEMSALQLEVLSKYEEFARILHSIDDTLQDISGTGKKDMSPEQLRQEMRAIEVKMGLVGTLLQSSVYSLVQQTIQQDESSYDDSQE